MRGLPLFDEVGAGHGRHFWLTCVEARVRLFDVLKGVFGRSAAQTTGNVSVAGQRADLYAEHDARWRRLLELTIWAYLLAHERPGRYAASATVRFCPA